MTGKLSVKSKIVTQYIKSTEEYWEGNSKYFRKQLPLKKPYKIGIHFIRDSKRKYDWVNPVQTVQDLMVQFNWIEDDNINIMYPYPMTMHREGYSSIKKESAGVFIRIKKTDVK